MGRRRQSQSHPPSPGCSPLSGDSKKNDAPLLNHIEALIAQAQGGAASRHTERITRHLLSQLVCLGSHTITGLLTTCGQQHADWSADYRLYGHERIEPQRLFAAVREAVCGATEGPIVAALDDTLLPKTGRKTHGVKYARDPMGPPFRVNFIRAQRFIQTSIAHYDGKGQGRMIPVDWIHAPTPPKPGRKATEQQLEQYKAQSKAARLTVVGAQRIQQLRQALDEQGAYDRTLWMTVDNSYTNGIVLKNLPERTTFVGRIRGDAKLYYLPQPNAYGRGRRRVYGERVPTPDELRQDDKHPWEKVEAFLGGKKRTLRAKELSPLRWRPATGAHTFKLVVIAPTSYKLTKNGKLLYRQPAYLICSDPQASLHDIIQHYLWRWDIEVNHRDEKTLLGVGEAQVRTPAAVQNVTATAVAAYAMLLTAAMQCLKEKQSFEHLQPPKWNKAKPKRPTTATLVKNLRYELWAKAIHFSSFAVKNKTNTKPEKLHPEPADALFYAQRYS